MVSMLHAQAVIRGTQAQLFKMLRATANGPASKAISCSTRARVRRNSERSTTNIRNLPQTDLTNPSSTNQNTQSTLQKPQEKRGTHSILNINYKELLLLNDRPPSESIIEQIGRMPYRSLFR